MTDLPSFTPSKRSWRMPKPVTTNLHTCLLHTYLQISIYIYAYWSIRAFEIVIYEFEVFPVERYASEHLPKPSSSALSDLIETMAGTIQKYHGL